jgi:hypothetical protein
MLQKSRTGNPARVEVGAPRAFTVPNRGRKVQLKQAITPHRKAYHCKLAIYIVFLRCLLQFRRFIKYEK